MFFEKNTQALLKSHPNHQVLIDRLNQTEPAQNIEVFETATGDYTIQVDQVFLHSPEGAEKEAKEVAKQHATSHRRQLHIVLGLGLGYVVQELHKNYLGKIAVYEPNLPLLRFVLENIDLSEYLGSGKIVMSSHRPEFFELIRGQFLYGDELDVLMLRGYGVAFAPEVKSFMTELEVAARERIRDRNTYRHFRFQWFEQMMGNIPYYPKTDTLELIANQFQGKPALVIARGPSLDKEIQSIKKIADSVVIVAAGGAVRRLCEEGIIPDFAVFYDANGQKEQIYGIPDETLSQINFLVAPFTQEYCYQVPSKRKIVFLGDNNYEIARWLDKVFGKDHVRIRGAGNVSVIALQSALLMGCNPISIVGMDLAMPNNEMYAGGVQVKLDQRGKLDVDGNDFLYPQKGIPTKVVKGQNGETLLSLDPYAATILTLEDMAKVNNLSKNPIKLINSSMGGAHIEGFELMPVAQFGETYQPQPFKSGTLLEYWNEGNPDTQKHCAQKKDCLIRGIREFQELLKTLEDLFQDALDDLQRVMIYDTETNRLARRASQTMNEFIKARSGNTLLNMLFVFEWIKLERDYCENTEQKAVKKANIMAAIAFLQGGLGIMSEKAVPIARRTEERLLEEDAPVHCSL